MSELHNIKGCDGNNEKNEVNTELAGRMEDDTTEHLKYEDETLQITDVQAFEDTDDGIPDDGGTRKLRYSSRLWSSTESPASAERFVCQTPRTDTTPHGATKLQSEQASLGLNSLHPSAECDVESSFVENLEQRISQNNHKSHSNVIIKVTEENDLQIPHIPNSTEGNFKLLERHHDEAIETSCRMPFDRNQAIDNDFSSADNLHHLSVAHGVTVFPEVNLEVINHSCNSTSGVTTDLSQSNSHIEILHNSLTVSEAGDCTDVSMIVHPSQSNNSDECLHDIEKLDLNTNHTGKGSFSDNEKENKGQSVNLFVGNSSKIAEMSILKEQVKSNVDFNDLQSEENDDIYEDAVDSFVASEITDRSDGSKIIMSGFIDTDKGSNSKDLTNQLENTDILSPKKIKQEQEVCSNKIDNLKEEVELNKSNTIENDQENEKSLSFLAENHINSPLSKNTVGQEIELLEEKKYVSIVQPTNNTAVEFDNLFCQHQRQNINCNQIDNCLTNYADIDKLNIGNVQEVEISLNIGSVSENQTEHLSSSVSEEIEVLVEETHQIISSKSEEIIEETHKIELSMTNEIPPLDLAIFEKDVGKNHQVDVSTSEELCKETEKINKLRLEEIVKETDEGELRRPESVVEETCSAEDFKLEVAVKEMPKIEPSKMVIMVGESNQLELNNPIRETFLEEILEDTHQAEVPALEDEETETYNMTMSKFEKAIKAIHEVELSSSSSEDIVKQRHQFNLSLFEENNELNEVELSKYTESLEETFKIEGTGFDKSVEGTLNVEIYEPEAVLEQAHQIGPFKSDGVIGKTPLSQPARSDEAIEESYKIETSKSEELVKETSKLELPRLEEIVKKDAHQLEFSGHHVEERYKMTLSNFEEVIKEIHQVEPSIYDDITKDTHYIKPPQFEEIRESLEIEPYKYEEVLKGAHKLEECRSQEIVDEICDMELPKLTEVVKETHQYPPCSSENIVENIYKLETSGPEENKGPHEIGQYNFEEADKECEEIETSRAEEVVKGTQKIELAILDDIVKGLHHNELSLRPKDVVEETVALEQCIFEKVFKENHQVEPTCSEESVEETHQIKMSCLEDIVERRNEVELSRFEDVEETYKQKVELVQLEEVVEGTHVVPQSRFVENIEIHQVDLSSSEQVVNEIHEMEDYRPEEIVEKTHEMEQSIFEEICEINYSGSEAVQEMPFNLLTTSERFNEKSQLQLSQPVEDHQLERSSAADMVEATYESGLCIISETDKYHQLEPSISKEIAEKTHEMELSIFEETHELKYSGSVEAVQEMHLGHLSTSEKFNEKSQLQLSQLVEDHQLELSSTADIVGEPYESGLCGISEIDRCHLVEPSTSKIIAEKTHEMDDSGPEEIVEKTYEMDQSIFEGMCKIEYSDSEEAAQKVHLGLVFETNKFEEAQAQLSQLVQEDHRLELSSSADIDEFEEVVKETHNMELPRLVKITNQVELFSPENVNQNTYHLETTSSQKHTEEREHLDLSKFEGTVEESNLVEKIKSNDFINDKQKLEPNHLEKIVEGTHVVQPSRFVENIKIHQADLSSSEQVAEETHKMEDSEHEESQEKIHEMEQSISEGLREIKNSGSKEAVQEINLYHLSTSEKFVEESQVQLAQHVEEDHQLELFTTADIVEESYETGLCGFSESEKYHQTKPCTSKEVAEKTHEICQSISEDILKQTLQMELSTCDVLVDETRKLQLSVSEKFVVVDNDKELPKFEVFEETFKKINSPIEELSNSNSNVSIDEQTEALPTDFGTDSSFHSIYSQQIQDMSLTIVSASTNNHDTFKFQLGAISQEEKHHTPSDHLSQTLTDLLNNVDREATNDFKTHSDQKTYDACYVPLSECNENNYSVTETGLQSFMEITMANTNVAVIEQALNNTTKQADPNLNQSTSHKNKCWVDSQHVESSPFSVNPYCNDNTSDVQSDLESLQNKNHEMMQQSMCDYVTNQSLKLAIPDSDQFSDLSHADEETRKKCEKQTESILLMKWPAQYHDDLKNLKEQIQFLSECSDQKDIYINYLKKNNEGLLQTLSKVIARSEEINEENSILKNESNKFKEDKRLMKEENEKLLKDLEAFKSIESEFFNFKSKNEELVLSIEKTRLDKEGEITILKDRIGELEHELLEIGQTIVDFQSKNEELSKLVESISRSKQSAINELIEDKTKLEEKVSMLDIHLETLGDLKEKNRQLKHENEIEEEKRKDLEKQNFILKEQENCLSEKLLKLEMDLKEKEQEIRVLFEGKVSLDAAVATLNKQLEDLNKIEDENHRLKSDLREEKDKREKMQELIKSLEEHNSLQTENITKLNVEVNEKSLQMLTLKNNEVNLKEIIETLNQRLEEREELESENEYLKTTIKQGDEQIKEMKNFKISLEEQVHNLKAENELLWKEIKVSTSKEQSLYALKEERLLLEEKLAQMKKEIQEINNFKSDNEHLIDELTNKDCEIRNLTADKRKLKGSLIKANDKLNERDAEIEKLNEELQCLDEHLNALNEEKSLLQNNLDEVTRKYEEINEELENESFFVAGNLCSVSEYLTSMICENSYLAEEISGHEAGAKQLSEEITQMKNKILEEKVLFDEMLSQRENLVNIVDSLKETVTRLTEEVNEGKHHSKEIIRLKEENDALTSKINDLKEEVTEFQDEKICFLQGMSSLSETMSNLLEDKQLLSEQLRLGSEMNERIAFLTAEKCQMEQRVIDCEQNNFMLLQTNTTLKNQLENMKEKDKIINDLEYLAKGLEDHLSSLNEELMSEISKNHYLTTKTSELESQISHNNEEVLELKNRILTQVDQLNASIEKDNTINDLEHLVSDLEKHMSSLNEELMSEISKNHYFSVENENFESQLKEITEEKLLLESMISDAEYSLKNRAQITNYGKNNNIFLQTCINEILLQITDFGCENMKLKNDINNVEMRLANSNQDISDLLISKQSLELELSMINEQKLELENKLTLALAKESQIEIFKEENENLLLVAEMHKCCENNIRLLHDEKSDLQMQVQALTESIEVLRSDTHQVNAQLNENIQLKEVMTKEIHSLTGEIWDSKLEPLIDIYQKLMKEFLNKEKEVIFLLQNDCESKIKVTQVEIVSLKNALDEKAFLTSKLETEVEECKKELKERDMIISGLEKDLLMIKNEVNSQASEIKDIKLQAEKEKETLISEMNKVHHDAAELEDKISLLSNEINCKNDEISQLKNDLEKVDCEKTNLLRRTEEDCGISKHQQDLIDDLSLRLNTAQELISQLNLQIQNKNNEVSQLSENLEKKEIEAGQYFLRIEEITPATSKLSMIENEMDSIQNVITSLNGEFNEESFVSTLQTCHILGNVIQLIVSKFREISSQLQISNGNLKFELAQQVEVCKSLETQINYLNEELKSHKLLYDEDSLQFKEEIATKNFTIANLTEALEKLKSNAHTQASEHLKAEAIKIENMKDELNKLKEENKKLHSESTKISYLTEVNRKLSWEIEELSRSIKFEKQSNVDLKAKCDLATNQVADLSKKNFQLEDKIDLLESKLKNHDVMSSLKIMFPLGIDTVDKQVQYLNEKLAEFDHINTKLNNLMDEHRTLKLEYEKSTEYIKKQEEKLNKIMKRELELKKQIASNLQTSSDSKILKDLTSELLSLFPDQNLSLAGVLLKLKSLVEERKEVHINNTEIEDLKKKIEELSQDNKDLDMECEMMNKHIKEQEDLLATVFNREEELKRLNIELNSQIASQPQIIVDSPAAAVDEDLKELFGMFPEKAVSIKDSINFVKKMQAENQTLKDKISESQEEYASLDKECEDMFKAYQEKERDLADVLKREASSVSDLKNKQHELENEIKALSEELQLARSQLKERENSMSVPAQCKCVELNSRLSELKMDLAERNAKITALELAFEADNFPLKKKVADLEKSLDQAKHKINELKSEVRRNQEQMCDVTVGLRADCERCRSLEVPVDPAAATALQQTIQEKNKVIQILKACCKSRQQRISELEEQNGLKMPRSQRSALKEGKENKSVPPSATKSSKSLQ